MGIMTALGMSSIDVLVVVDVENALGSKNLGDNVYLIDTNKHAGSGNEGKTELYTACKDGQVITWNVVGVAPSSDVTITQFLGQMVTDKICVPQQFTGPNGSYWTGRVEAQGTKGNQQYTMQLTMDGNPMTFDPFLVIS